MEIFCDLPEAKAPSIQVTANQKVMPGDGAIIDRSGYLIDLSFAGYIFSMAVVVTKWSPSGLLV